MKFAIYGNGDSGNHGCEAIVRGTAALFGPEHSYLIQSAAPDQDLRYGLDRLGQVRPAMDTPKKDLHFLWAYARLKLTGNYVSMDGRPYRTGIRAMKGRADVALSVGGDNYCYGDSRIYAWLNRQYHRQGIKTVLWGCSVEPAAVQEKSVSRDLASYDLIVARESITFDALSKINPNTILSPDPAFFMEPRACALDPKMESGNVIGINISPMIVSNEGKAGMAYENYKNLIAHILEHTDAYIALIPHVVWASNDDRTVLKKLYEEFDRNDRLIPVEDHTAPELKYIISRCRLFVGARTHATIAAYSSGVPTLVVGYSVKARGIARDLFGTEAGYVLPVQSLKEPMELTNAFQEMADREEEIRAHLNQMLPNYCACAKAAVQAVRALEKAL